MPRRIGMCVCAAFATAALAGPLNPPAGQPQPSGPSLKDLEVKLNQILAGIGARADGERGGVNIFMTGSGLIGGSPIPGHEGAIELESVALSLGSQPGVGPGGSPLPYLNPIICIMRVDRAYPEIFRACARGTNIGTVEIEFCIPAGQQDEQCYLTITLHDVRFTSSRLNMSYGQTPSNAISLEPTVLEFIYIPFVDGKPQTPIIGGWDFSSNTPS